MRFPLFLYKACIGVPSQAFFTPPIHADGLAVRTTAQRPLSAAPLAASTDRHEPRHATALKNRAQVRGRASGVRCKAMLGGYRGSQNRNSVVLLPPI